MSLLFLGKTPLCLLKRLGIDLTALEPHAATQSSHSAGRRAHAGINDQAPRRDQGFEVVDRFVQTLAPSRGVSLLTPLPWNTSQTVSGNRLVPLPKTRSGFQALITRLWWMRLCR